MNYLCDEVLIGCSLIEYKVVHFVPCHVIVFTHYKLEIAAFDTNFHLGFIIIWNVNPRQILDLFYMF